MSRHDCIIIGGGSAGLLYASIAKSRNGLILEATGHAGTKLRMSGGGHCNYTHAGSIKEFMTCYGDAGRKIRKLLYKYNNETFTAFLGKHGIPSVTDEDGRVLPASQKAQDILDLLLELANRNNFQLALNARVSRIQALEDGGYECTTEDGKTYQTEKLILATGGKSYPSTGSNGQMWKVLEQDLGIRITDPRPSLAPITVTDYPFEELAGLTFPEAKLTITRTGQKNQGTQGIVLLTHRNFSGPAILNLSVHADVGSTLHISYIGDVDTSEVQKTLQQAMDRSKAEPASIIAKEYGLPKRFAHAIVTRSLAGGSNVSPKKLAQILTDDRFEVAALPDWNTAMATHGGIALDQIDFKTMQFKEYPGLYAIGEALDVDGITGGYNIQFAFSSAAMAADAEF